MQDDFLIAMQLQQQEDAEYIAARCVTVRVVTEWIQDAMSEL